MITMLREITDWDMPKGVYHVNDHGELVAYQAPGGELQEFKSPMRRFSKARRKFVVLDTYEDENEDTSGTKHEFIGSKGNTYVVTVDGDGDISCTCPGYRFRGKCKHYTAIADEMK